MSATDLAHVPAASAPPGLTSNLENPVGKDTTVGMTLAIVGMVFATTFLLIRIYTKAFLAKLFGPDDVALIVSWALSMGVQITIVYCMAQKIIGIHMWDISVENFKVLARITAVDSVVYLAVMGLVKYSILYFYLKLSREKWFTYSIYATLALVAGFSVSLMLSLMFACTPLKRVWDPTITEGRCINRGKIYLATAGLNAATDVIMLVLPIPMIIKLQVKLRQKIGLMLIFAIGSLTMVTSLIRLVLMPPLVKALDLSWALATPAAWICIEGNLVIICGCLPILRLFLRHVAPRLIGENPDGTARGRTGHVTGSSELSTLERSKRNVRNYSRMNKDLADETHLDHDDGSEILINAPSSKIGLTIETAEVAGQDRQEGSLETSPPVPYSQLNRPGVVRAPTYGRQGPRGMAG